MLQPFPGLFPEDLMEPVKNEKKPAPAFDHTTYLSVFSWRYGSKKMREIWSLDKRLHLQRRIWVAVAEAMHAQGLVSAEELADLVAHEGDIDIGAILAKEDEIRHDIMASILTFQSVATVGGGKIHLGMTSEDNSSNLDVILLRQSLELVLASLEALIDLFADQVERYADLVTVGYTHLQSGTATTVGFRLATYLQDLLLDREQLRAALACVRPKGLTGATGTRASYTKLLPADGAAARLERDALEALELDLPDPFTVTGQTYPRKVDLVVLNALAGLAMTLHKFGFDIRLLQSTPFNEVSEPFKAEQVGSTAMPWKRNPINSENLDSLARVVPALTQVAWTNGAFAGLERTLDESASRRLILPTAFLLVDEVLTRATRVIKGLVVKEKVIERNLRTYGLFAGIENLLMHLVTIERQDRQKMHELLRLASLDAWRSVEETGTNPLVALIEERLRAHGFMGYEGGTLFHLESGAYNVGDAPARARALVAIARTRNDT